MTLKALNNHHTAEAINTADVAIITKIDLAAATEFDADAAHRNIQAVRPGMQILEVSAKTGDIAQAIELMRDTPAGAQRRVELEGALEEACGSLEVPARAFGRCEEAALSR